MRGIDYEIDECEFHIEGLGTIIRVLLQMPRPDPSIIRTMAYALQIAHDRLDTLLLMKQVSR